MKHLELRRGLYYAVLTIPAPLRAEHFAGKIRFIQSLQTSNLKDARFRAGPLITEWQAAIRKARGVPFDPLLSEARQLREELAQATDWQTADAVEGAAEMRAIELAGKIGREAASDFYKEATGQATPLKDLAADWRKSLSLKPKTIDQMARDVDRLVEYFKHLERLTPPAVKVWSDKLVKDGATHSSLKRILASGRSLWNYLQATSVVPLHSADPFAGMIRLTAKKAERTRTERQPFKPEDVTKLYGWALAGR